MGQVDENYFEDKLINAVSVDDTAADAEVKDEAESDSAE